uniref:Uncharacterized protein n=1 Tax=Schmidtea mediterranea TaxID=79327 RepID=A0A1S6KMK3_SCHMD|nr:hypothetical protein 17916 [Schmidtea mediterranea]
MKSQNQLGKVRVSQIALKDEIVHKSMRTLINQSGTRPKVYPFIHNKVLIPGDYRNLIEQFQIPTKMHSTIGIQEELPTHIFCHQLGSNLCWRCSRKMVNRKLKEQIETDLTNSEPEMFLRLICIENVLKDMNLPLFSNSETAPWKSGLSNSETFSDGPLFFPNSQKTAQIELENVSNEISNLASNIKEKKKFTNKEFNYRMINSNKTIQDSKREKKSMKYVEPPVFESFY